MHIQRFVDKVSIADSKQNKDFVMSMTDARGLRDEIAKLLIELHDKPPAEEPVIQIEVKGGKFK
jgi:hypothetical protein